MRSCKSNGKFLKEILRVVSNNAIKLDVKENFNMYIIKPNHTADIFRIIYTSYHFDVFKIAFIRNQNNLP